MRRHVEIPVETGAVRADPDHGESHDGESRTLVIGKGETESVACAHI